MARRNLVFIFILITFRFTAQVIPHGLYIDFDGKVKFRDAEPNLRGYVEDTVFVIFYNDTIVDDLYNVLYNDLTLIESPDDGWTLPSSGDPSRVNDTTEFNERSYSNNPLTFNVPTIWIDTFVLQETQKELINKYSDLIRGDKLTIENIEKIRTLLQKYQRENYGMAIPYQTRNDLYVELSHYDSVVDKIAVYDYLVDHVVFYNYDSEKLTSILGYHWNLGVEFDSLHYDKRGKLVYFSRESLGSIRNEFFFEYDRKKRVISSKHFYSITPNSDEGLMVREEHETVNYEYKKGTLISKSVKTIDGIISTVKYKFQGKNPKY